MELEMKQMLAILAAWRIEENSALVPATAVVKWIDGGPDNPDLTRVSDQSPQISTKH
jgi:hypothetical protein